MACRNYRKSTMRAYSVASQTVVTGANVDFDTFNGTGCSIEANGSKSVTLKTAGLYLVTFNATGVESGTAGGITVQLKKNGEDVVGATATQYSGDATHPENVAFSEIIEVMKSCACIDNEATLSVENAGVGATFSNVQLNVIKLC